MATSGHPVCGAEIEFPRGRSIQTGLVQLEKTKGRRPAKPGKEAYGKLFSETKIKRSHNRET